ncbi:MAG TPA: hypothetical protein DEA80_24725, partial [Afipia sp.]|nr:hypothetical protein [Afipia sp.]
MSNHSSDLFVDVRGRIVLIAMLTAVFGTTAAWSQQAHPQPQIAPSQQAAPPEPPAPPPNNPGLVEEIGRVLKDSA